MRIKQMFSNRRRWREQRGFALIAALLLLMLMSALAVGLLMMVNTETMAGGNDLQNNVAFHAAEGGLEKMTADLAAVFTNIQAPNKNDIESVSTLLPNTPGITYPGSTLDSAAGYKVTVTAPTQPDGVTVIPQWGTIKSGPNKDLNAQIIPVTLAVTAQAKLENQVRMTRTAEIALIPVFQFGVFCDSDCAFFNSPNMDFAGRVHSNADVYLGVSQGSTINFHDKISAYGNIVRQNLPNGLGSSSYSNTGTVNVPTAAGGCPSSNCRALGLTEGSVTGNASSSQNTNFPSISKNNYNGLIIHGNYGSTTNTTGAICLTLPFTGGSSKACATGPGQAPNYQGGSIPYEIIRRPPGTTYEATSSAVGQSRYFNNAEIRILIADDPAENHLDGSAVDGQDIRLANVQTNSGAPDYSSGVPVGSVGNVYFAEGTTANNTTETNWVVPLPDAQIACYPNCFGGNGKAPLLSASTWNLIDGYIRVEYQDNASPPTWHAVTREWLELGFARDFNPGTSTINPNAILIFQQLADRNADNAVTAGQSASSPTNTYGTCQSSDPSPPTCSGVTLLSKITTGCTGGKAKTFNYSCPAITPELVTDSGTGKTYTGAATRNNWYPINFYDPREGETRDNLTTQSAGSCGVLGVMNAVELDVGNLKKWLAGTIGSSGNSVPYTQDNGYIIYFSDRRGMRPNPWALPSASAPRKDGDSGFEDVINISAGTGGVPDGVLEGGNSTASPEDVNINGQLDNYGSRNLGLGFGSTVNSTINANTSKPNPYTRLASCINTGRPNWVSGARHVLRLVDGGRINSTQTSLPTKPDGTGGFTVASENPVYILGNYNADSTDPSTWANASGGSPHSAAAVVADSVVLLSNKWTNASGGNGGDIASFQKPFGSPTYGSTGTSLRPAASTTYYRVAIASGKNREFTFPSWGTSLIYGYGTDGGVHNFLRFMEDWDGPSATAYYKGSMVSFYYSTYNTGLFKCCGDAVYHPPTRNYSFDSMFSNPANLPPGTPMFRDVNNLSYSQDFTTNSRN